MENSRPDVLGTPESSQLGRWICPLINKANYFSVFYKGAQCVPLSIQPLGYIVLGIFPHFRCSTRLRKTQKKQRPFIEITNGQLAQHIAKIKALLGLAAVPLSLAFRNTAAQYKSISLMVLMVRFLFDHLHFSVSSSLKDRDLPVHIHQNSHLEKTAGETGMNSGKTI